MAPALLAAAEIGLAAAMLAVGVATAWTSRNLIKRTVGVVFAQIGALLALAAAHAPVALAMTALGGAFATLIVGAALTVRLQEAYGGVEAPELDAEDERDEPAEPMA